MSQILEYTGVVDEVFPVQTFASGFTKREFVIGNDAAVVWNPGPGGKLPDLAPEDWRKFVCVEPVSDWPGGRTLAPGERHVLAASIQCTLKPRATA